MANAPTTHEMPKGLLRMPSMGICPPSPLCAAVDGPKVRPRPGPHYVHCTDHQSPFTLRIITGNSHPELAEDVAALVGYEMRRTEDGSLCTPKVFANGMPVSVSPPPPFWGQRIKMHSCLTVECITSGLHLSVF